MSLKDGESVGTKSGLLSCGSSLVVCIHDHRLVVEAVAIWESQRDFQGRWEGWLHTGDMARRDEDGFLYIVSRKSDFIKSASYRISPGEIEDVIAEMGGIEDVAAIGVPDTLFGETIAVCVVCPADRFDAEAIRAHCQSRLPLYKLPRYILHVPEIPRTASGKKKYYILREQYQGLEGSSS